MAEWDEPARAYEDDEPNIEAAPAKRRFRRFDIYDLRVHVRIVSTLVVAGSVTFGLVLGDIWLWRLLYG